MIKLNPEKVDLHCHSSFSDGLLSPADLLQKAQSAGITLLALTDHDTVEGSKQLLELESSRVRIIGGIEISVCWKKYDIHVLGLNLDVEHSSLVALIQKQSENRISRARHISDKLACLGIMNTFEKARELAGHQHVGRPHFARVLLQEGRVKDLQAAFTRYLGRGKSAYMPAQWVSLSEAVQIIIEAGGTPVLAHPLKYRLTRTRLHALIEDFKSAGGQGLEVVSGAMTVNESLEMAGLCVRFHLLASSGSDFHGEGVSSVSPGRQRALPLNCSPVWTQWNI